MFACMLTVTCVGLSGWWTWSVL